MLPSGHIATGVLLGLGRSRHVARSRRRLILAGSVASACLPDVDLVLPRVLDRLGVEHRLNSGRHHSWMTHTPIFWAGLSLLGLSVGRQRCAPVWAPEAARLFALGAVLHLAGDTVANTVALLWPLRRREYGLSLDRMPGVDDHPEYLRRYPASPAGRLEAILIVAAAGWSAARLRSGGA